MDKQRETGVLVIAATLVSAIKLRGQVFSAVHGLFFAPGGNSYRQMGQILNAVNPRLNPARFGNRLLAGEAHGCGNPAFDVDIVQIACKVVDNQIALSVGTK